MLSRASLLTGQFSNKLQSTAVRSFTTSLALKQRDEKNFPRPVRLIEPAKVRLGFIPDDWFQAFYKKTGVTGPYVLGTSVLTYLISKEIYVMEHEYYTGISIAIMVYFAMVKLGPNLSKWLDKEVDDFEAECNKGRVEALNQLNEAIKNEENEQKSAEGQRLLVAAKKENVDLQLEAAYRERIVEIFNEVKRRLDYQVAKQAVLDRIAQRHMVDWIVNGVLKSLTPEQDKTTLTRCLTDLEELAKLNKA